MTWLMTLKVYPFATSFVRDNRRRSLRLNAKRDLPMISNILTIISATIFADSGFDVWVANSRGSPPSQKHIGYGPEDERFWNFT